MPIVPLPKMLLSYHSLSCNPFLVITLPCLSSYVWIDVILFCPVDSISLLSLVALPSIHCMCPYHNCIVYCLKITLSSVHFLIWHKYLQYIVDMAVIYYFFKIRYILPLNWKKFKLISHAVELGCCLVTWES